MRNNQKTRNKIKRLISITLIIFLMIGRAWPLVIMAEDIPPEETQEVQQTEEITPTPEPSETQPEVSEENNEVSPTPTPEVEIDNDAEAVNDIESEANTGENQIVSPTPTPSPTPTEEVVDPDLVEGNGEEEQVCVVEELEEGEICPEPDLEDQEVATEEATLANTEEETEQSTIDTGDAVSSTVVENSVNTTEVNSEILYQTLNIFVPGDVDLTLSPLVIAENVLSGDKSNDPVVNVMVLDAENVAYLSNDIVALANTGDNEIGDAQEAAINTGDAYALVSLLNKVNTTIIGSTIHIVTINIFGDVDGNILLPEFEGSSEEGCCAEVIHIDNTAVVNNNVDSEANSGENTIVTDGGSSTITTGGATSVVNVLNIVNTTLVGVTFYNLYINTLGVWVGNFLGWDNLGGAEGGGNLAINSSGVGDGSGNCPGCVGDTFIGNEAYVTNNVSSTANTGGNGIDGGGNIYTGNAYSSVSIINLINSTLINSFGFFGFINIFGFFEGDVGGASLFDEEPEPESEVQVQEQSEPGFVREAGGQLEIYQYNNVGEFVFPGDTVTFFFEIKNPGTGKVYETYMRLSLINEDGVDVGGGVFPLGDLKQGEGFKISTGLVLADETAPGRFQAHAQVFGYVGADSEEITAWSDSYFRVVGYASYPLMPGIVEETKAIEPEEEVLGAIAVPSGMSMEDKYKLFLFGLLTTYIPAKGYQKRKEIGIALSKSGKYMGQKSVALRSFFASFLA